MRPCRNFVSSLIYKGKTWDLETLNNLCQLHLYRGAIIWMKSFLLKLIRILHLHVTVGDRAQKTIWPFPWGCYVSCWNWLLIKEFRNLNIFCIFYALLTICLTVVTAVLKLTIPKCRWWKKAFITCRNFSISDQNFYAFLLNIVRVSLLPHRINSSLHPRSVYVDVRWDSSPARTGERIRSLLFHQKSGASSTGLWI